jgi:serine/threonine protein kinase
MAPEIHQNKPYTGTSVDIFAAGHILFICRAFHPGFKKAVKNDPHYKFIGGKKPELFWKAMERGKPKGFFSESFKDLVQRMIKVDKDGSRITMEGIKSHPWYTSDELPTYE